MKKRKSQYYNYAEKVCQTQMFTLMAVFLWIKHNQTTKQDNIILY